MVDLAPDIGRWRVHASVAGVGRSRARPIDVPRGANRGGEGVGIDRAQAPIAPRAVRGLLGRVDVLGTDARVEGVRTVGRIQTLRGVRRLDHVPRTLEHVSGAAVPRGRHDVRRVVPGDGGRTQGLGAARIVLRRPGRCVAR